MRSQRIQEIENYIYEQKTVTLDVYKRQVYDYVVSSIAYDYEKAESVTSGYLPDVDETLATGKGICFEDVYKRQIWAAPKHQLSTRASLPALI